MRITTENISTRISEIETVFQPKTLSKETLSLMLSKKSDINVIFSKIDSLESLVNEMKSNLETLEDQVRKAELDLNIPSNSGGILDKLNSILSKPSPPQSPNVKHSYESPEICQTSKYFE